MLLFACRELSLMLLGPVLAARIVAGIIVAVVVGVQAAVAKDEKRETVVISVAEKEGGLALLGHVKRLQTGCQRVMERGLRGR